MQKEGVYVRPEISRAAAPAGSRWRGHGRRAGRRGRHRRRGHLGRLRASGIDIEHVEEFGVRCVFVAGNAVSVLGGGEGAQRAARNRFCRATGCQLPAPGQQQPSVRHRRFGQRFLRLAAGCGSGTTSTAANGLASRDARAGALPGVPARASCAGGCGAFFAGTTLYGRLQAAAGHPATVCTRPSSATSRAGRRSEVSHSFA